MSRELYDLVIRRGGEVIERCHSHLDLDREADLRAQLLAAVRRAGAEPEQLVEFSMAVHRPGRTTAELNYVAIHH